MRIRNLVATLALSVLAAGCGRPAESGKPEAKFALTNMAIERSGIAPWVIVDVNADGDPDFMAPYSNEVGPRNIAYVSKDFSYVKGRPIVGGYVVMSEPRVMTDHMYANARTIMDNQIGLAIGDKIMTEDLQSRQAE